MCCSHFDPLSLVLTLPCLLSAVLSPLCSRWDGRCQTPSHGLPAHLGQQLPRMGFLLLLLLSPSSSHQLSASERGSQCPSCLQAQEDPLPAALHQESHLHLGQNGTVIVCSSRWDLRTYSSLGAVTSSLWHSSLSPLKKKVDLQLRQRLGVWSRSIALCSQGNCCLSSCCSPRERQPLEQHSGFMSSSCCQSG